MDLAVRRSVQRSHLVEELVENWQSDHQRALAAREVEELMQECVDLAKLNRQATQTLVDRFWSGSVKGLESAAEVLRAAVQRTLLNCQVVQKEKTYAEQHGFMLEGAAAFTEACQNTLLLARQVDEQLPRFDSGLAEEARAAFLRGDHQTVEELLHAAQNGSFPAG